MSYYFCQCSAGRLTVLNSKVVEAHCVRFVPKAKSWYCDRCGHKI